MVYRYTESGLDNVFLDGGVTIHKTPYGKGVSIQNTAGLHKVIGQWLIARPLPLNGAELRFLRTEMELTQRALAGILGTSEQTLRLWEKARGKFITGSADRLLRTVYSEFLGNNVHIRQMLQKLADLDRLENSAEAYFHKTSKSWKPLDASQLEHTKE
jgi:DNA-binding transcriptional regulator YiaG